MKSLRFTYNYTTKNDDSIRELSVRTTSSTEANKIIVNRIADLEFIEPEEVNLIGLVKIEEYKDEYFVCESCES